MKIDAELDQLSKEILDIKDLLAHVPQDEIERENHFNIIESRLKAAKESQKSLKQEYRIAGSKSNLTKMKNLEKELNAMEGTLKTMKSPSKDVVLGEIVRIQNDTRDSLDKSLKLASDCLEVGVSTLASLQDQGEQMKKIDDGMNEVSERVETSKKLVKKFKRWTIPRFRRKKEMVKEDITEGK